MIKVFLAEDEIVMREGIKNNIPWEKEGLDFVGEASDGELALPLIKKNRPDILITDIKMPFMDGLELSKYVKKEIPDIKIIILSGYNDFDYAREAIKIGVAEYLVKPITSVQLLEAVKGVAEQVRADRRQKLNLQQRELEQEEAKKIERMRFFKRLAAGKYPVSELLKEGSELGIELIAQKYNILLFQVFEKEEQEITLEDKSAVLAFLREQIKMIPEIELIEGDMLDGVFLLKENSEKTLEEVELQVEEVLDGISRKYPNMEYFGGIGVPVTRLSELNKCYEEADHSFAYRYLEPHNQVVHSKSIYREPGMGAEIQLSDIKADRLDRNAVEVFLKTGLKSEVVSFVEEYFSSIGENNLNSSIFRQYVALDMCFAATGMVEQLGYQTEELMERCGNPDVAAASFSSLTETKRFLHKLYEEAIEMRDGIASKKYRLLLEDAKAYIRQNYQNDEISLNTVAAYINLSPNHFSSIFKQETGVTFVEYLTSVRMEKARELLRSTSMKTAEIALAVGYKDSHYFSSLFKKTQDCTPREFRSRE